MEEDEELFVHLSDDESGEIDDLPPSNVVDTQVQTDYYPYTYTGLVKIHGPSISSRENCYKNLFTCNNCYLWLTSEHCYDIALQCDNPCVLSYFA